MSSYPQAGELWYYKRNPSLMVLVIRVVDSKELVLTKDLFREQGESYRGMNSFRYSWRPVAKEDTCE